MDKNFLPTGYRVIDFTLYKSNIVQLRREWKKFVKQIPQYPGTYHGRGIVICAGGLGYFTCCWIAIQAVRQLGCTLPIELWYVGHELSEEIIEGLKDQQVTCKNVVDYGGTALSGYRVKPFAIFNSSFKEVLYLDADNIPVRNPEELFETKEYLEYGTLFWPDFWKTAPDNPIWPIVESTDYDIQEQESGQLLIDKEKCWRELNLCQYFNTKSQIYYRLLLGDKDTFKFAWMALKTPFYMIPIPVGTCGYHNKKNNAFIGTTMVQHNPAGDICFLHRNLLKWDITKPDEISWQKIRRFKPGAVTREYHINFTWELGHAFVDLQGDVEEANFTDYFGDLEEVLLGHLYTLRNSDLYARFLIYLHFSKYRTGDLTEQVVS